MKKTFVTFLGTADFLPGVVALQASLSQYNSGYGLLVMVSKEITDDVIDMLIAKKMHVKVVDDLENPHDLGADKRGFRYMFTKLRIFELIEYEKLVYLDSDMIICDNIESLFDAPHMSAVVAGALDPGNSLWSELNAGLLVIKPSAALAEKMYSLVKQLPSDDGSDQGFLHSFYKEWPHQTNLHLHHKYNVPLVYLDSYCDEAGFSFSYIRRKLITNIAVIHYWGAIKPWQFDIRTFSRRDQSRQVQAIVLWWDMFNGSPATL